jgi:hypothetical protein
MRFRRLSLVAAFLFVAVSAAAQTDITGSWSGTLASTEFCHLAGGPTTSYTAPMTFYFVQQGTTLSGVFIVYNIPDYDEHCGVRSRETRVLPFEGNISGNNFSGVSEADDTIQVSGSVNGTSMTVNLAGTDSAVLTATATLTRGSTALPASTLTGSYSGSYSSTLLPCPGTDAQLPPVTYSGSMNAQVFQLGSAFSADVTITQDKRDHYDAVTHKCTVVDVGTSSLFVNGVVNGNTISGSIFENGDPAPFAAVISGDTITGFGGSDPREPSTFTITRNGALPATPRVVSFGASPPTIRAGQSATLSWSTNAANVVTIDNGIGAQPASGFVTVSPTTTTTYTITARQGALQSTATATVEVLTGPVVNITQFPATMLEVAGSGGVTTTYALTNSGSASTTISLGQTATFFSQSPTNFTLAAGATQTITITGGSQPAGSYEGASTISGNGVPSGLEVRVKLLSAAAPTGSVTADPTASRVDVAAAGSTSISSSVSFKNNGTSRLTGVLNSDVPWIIPQSGAVTIDPGQTATFSFTIDRTKRPDASTLIGSLEGTLTLSFLTAGGSTFAKVALDGNPTNISVTIVKVVDTVQPAVTTAGIPVIAPGEVALFIAGVGHVTGVGGAQFVSDVSLLNPQGGKAIDDAKLYYTPTTGTATAARTTSLNPVPGQVSVSLADVVKSVFAGTDERGTLQIRSKDADKLAASATVLTTNNPAGTFGNTIPIFRSDRAIAANESLVLTGVRKDSTTHTNVYVQEANGADGSAQIDFLAADGSTVSTRTEAVSAFKLLPLDNSVPANAVAVVITNKSVSSAKFVAYATPVDERSNDTWAIADWSKQLGYTSSEPVVIPVAGSVHGANNTFYRTDLALTNRATDTAIGSLRYVSRTGATAEQQINLASKETKIISDVITFLGVSGDTVGYLIFTPLSGSVAVSSRTFTTAGTKPDTFGSGVPAIATGAALRFGGTRPIAGLADAARTTVVAAKPATYRTNFGLMEVTGQPVTVRVTFRFTFPAGAKAQGIGGATRDYALNGNQFLLLNSIAGEILGVARLQYGDLSNVEADFQVIDGTGAVMLFTSSVDNATGDSILRTE